MIAPGLPSTDDNIDLVFFTADSTSIASAAAPKDSLPRKSTRIGAGRHARGKPSREVLCRSRSPLWGTSSGDLSDRELLLIPFSPSPARPSPSPGMFWILLTHVP